MAVCITKAYGLDRIRARVPAWHAAMQAGKRAAPKCVATNAAGERCGGVRMRGADRCRCHLTGPERDATDIQRAVEARKKLRSTNTMRRADGETALRNIARRQLHRAWKRDPTVAGATLVLEDHDESRVLAWLAENHGLDLERRPFHDNGRPISARAIDRLRWAGTLALTQRITAEGGRRRVFAALRDDLAWWRKHHGELTP